MPVQAPPRPREPVTVPAPGDSRPHATGEPGLGAAALLVLGMVLSLLGATTHADHDMYHQMALFREALRLGAMPAADVFAYTPTVSPSMHHEWGTGAVLYALTVGAGLGGTGVMLLRYILLAGMISAVVACARRRGATPMSLLAAAPLGAVLLLLALHTVRAQLFTLAFIALLLLLLERDRLGSRGWIVGWLAAFPLWVNLHGGFVAGTGLFALYAAEVAVATWWRAGVREAFRRTWHLLLGGGVMALLVGLNPYGWAYVPNLWHAIRMERPHITEWRPLIESGPLLTGVFAAALLLAAYGIRAGGSRRAGGAVLLLVTAVLAWSHVRHLSIFGVVWMAYAPAWLAATPIAARSRRVWAVASPLAAGVGLAVALLGAGYAWTQRAWEVRVPTALADGTRVYPAGAVAYLREAGFRGNLMTPFQVGAYVSWHLHPAVKVSLDSRYEAAYAPGVLEAHVTAYRALPGWQAVVAAYPTDAILVRRDTPLYSHLVRSGPALPGRWEGVYRDDAYVVFARGTLAKRLPRSAPTIHPPAAFP